MTTNYYNQPYYNGHKIYQHFPFQSPPKNTKTGMFGMKIYHLENLAISHLQKAVQRRFSSERNAHLSVWKGRIARWYILKLKIATWINFEGPWNGKCLFIKWLLGMDFGHLV
jgi:hypothetical protein